MSIESYNKEFGAADRLAKNYRRVTLSAPVDDDFPEVLHGFDSALRELIDTVKDTRPHWFASQSQSKGVE
jgi:hypothetical protein